MKRIAIVGAGFSGTVTAARLLERSQESIHITLFDRSGNFGEGIAYATKEPVHFLNVPSAKMSAFEERPSHFADWLTHENLDGANGFALRRDYGRYLQSLLQAAPSNPHSELSLVKEAVVALEDGFLLQLASGGYQEADIVVLAMGYLPETSFGHTSVHSPYAPESWPKAVRRVVVIGSGLTALDAAASVFARHPGAEVTLISRHGLVAEGFLPSESGYEPNGPVPETARGLLRWLRQEADQADGWTPVFDAMRPRWEPLWQSLPERERQRFLGRLVRQFDRYRHRVPPPQHEALAPYWESGALQVRKGEVISATSEGVSLRDGLGFEADLVIDGSGFSTDWGRSRDPLATQLLDSGKVRSGPFGMGICADPHGRVAEGIFTLGPPLRGTRWETTAVPEIRRQALAVTESILG